MRLWYPQAEVVRLPDAGAFVAGARARGVLHTTEGSTSGGAISSYRENNSAPHFTVQGSTTIQHIPINRAARALKNQSGGVETNRLFAIQIEVVGHAIDPYWPSTTIESVRKLMAWVEGEVGIRPEAPRFLAYPASYGINAPQRMSANGWKTWNGWCGHQHVPENSHGDPGSIPITALLRRTTLTPEAPQPTGAPMANAPFVCGLVHPNGGYLMIGEDGGVFSYGDPEPAPFYGSLGGITLNQPIVDAQWTPTFKGYYMFARDGGVFPFGDARYQGNTLWAG